MSAKKNVKAEGVVLPKKGNIPPPSALAEPESQKAESQKAESQKAESQKAESQQPKSSKPEKLPDDFTGVISAPPQNERGQGIGRGTKYRAKVFGHPVTGIIRWMWKNNFSFLEIKTALADLLEIPPQDTTLKLQKSQLKNGTKPNVPDLTEEQANALKAYMISTVSV